MSEMMSFISWLLPALADFLITPPVSYILGMILAILAVKWLKILIS